MYNEFYGFSEDPFSLSPDPRVLFLAVSHYETLSSMISGIKERKGINIISGEVGTGKTTLIYALLKDLSAKIKTAFVFYTKTSFQDILKNILAELELPVFKDNLTALLVLFNKYLQERMIKDETVAIIFDEAQNLEIEVMEDIFRLCSRESPTGKLVQILLVGQPELEAKLASVRLQAFEDKIAIRNRLKPLTQKECEKYIDHRLKFVGSSSSKVLTPEAIERIVKFSDGIPRVINMVCDHAFLTGYATSNRKIDGRIVKEVLKDLGYLKPHRTVILPGVLPVLGWFKSYWAAHLRRVRLVKAILVIVILVVSGLGTLHFINKDSSLKLPSKRNERTTTLEAKLLEKEKSTGKERAVLKPTERVVSAKKDWTLSFLAHQYYNDVNPTLLDIILEFNPIITDLNRIFVNQQIQIPSITEDLLLIQAPDQNYKIYLGTFIDEQSFHSLKSRPVLKGRNFEILPRKVTPKITWLRVIAGEFKTRDEGLKTIRTLRQQGLLPAFAGSPK